MLELWAASCVLEGVLGTQDVAVPGREVGGDGVIGLGSRRETIDSGSKGTRLATLKSAYMLFAVIEA